MELNFSKVGNEWVAEFEATNHFNLHLERETIGSVVVCQRGSESGEYAVAFSKGGIKVLDQDFGALVYPKYIRVASSGKVLKSKVTFAE